jgi:hypothetical protein
VNSQPLYRKKTYPTRNTKTLLFFICPFGTKFSAVHLTIKKLQRAGYYVVAYDTHNNVFYAANPNILIQIIDKISTDISATIQDYKAQGFNDFGFFSTSLGAFIAYNCVSQIPQLRWGVFNTGGNIAEAMWRIKKPRRNHEKKGLTLEQVAKAWHGLQYPHFSGLTGNSYIFFSSPSDEIAPLDDIEKYMKPVQAAGAKTTLIGVRAFGHVSTAIRGFRQSVSLLAKARSEVK